MNIWELLKVGCLIMFLILASCKGDDIIINTNNSDDNRSLSIALPAIKYTLSISDVIKEIDDDLFFSDEDGLLNFQTTQKVSFALEELAEINDIVENWSYAINKFITKKPTLLLEAFGEISFQEKINFQDTDYSYVTLNVDPADLFYTGISKEELYLAFKLSNSTIKMFKDYFDQNFSDINEPVLKLNGIAKVKDLAKFDFKDVAYTLNLKNPLGMPFDIHAHNIHFIKTIDNIPRDVFLLPDGFFKSDLDISNPFPEKMTFNAFFTSNRNDEITNKLNLIENLNMLYADLQIDMPLWFRVNTYTRSDTIDFDFKKMMWYEREKVDLVEALTVHLDFYNKLPFDVNANLFVVDAEGNKIEDILSNFKSLLTVGKMNAEGRVSKAKHTNVTVEFNKNQVLKFFDQNAMLLILQTQASTHKNETEFVKIFEDADLKISISLETLARTPNFN